MFLKRDETHFRNIKRKKKNIFSIWFCKNPAASEYLNPFFLFLLWGMHQNTWITNSHLELPPYSYVSISQFEMTTVFDMKHLWQVYAHPGPSPSPDLYDSPQVKVASCLCYGTKFLTSDLHNKPSIPLAWLEGAHIAQSRQGGRFAVDLLHQGLCVETAHLKTIYHTGHHTRGWCCRRYSFTSLRQLLCKTVHSK